MNERDAIVKRRSNFALDAETVALLHTLIDRHEREHGFRPPMTQIVSGLIRKAAAKGAGDE